MKETACLYLIVFMMLFGYGEPARSADSEIASMGERIVKAALDKLDVKPESSLACFTNAGYVTYKGASTRILLDVIAKNSSMSLGKGNLLTVHARWDEPLWFAFVEKEGNKKLMLTFVSMTKDSFQLTEPINVRVDIDQDYKVFEKVLGSKAFTLVGLTNGWADKLPAQLMQGALYHDHLCCGISSGYFTVRFILENLPLKEGQRYVYIGAPAWCQDDYIMRPLNLTPGKHGYYTMSYPWSRPWKTGGKVYDKLGGIIVRFDHQKNVGYAHLLRFDWREDAFKKFINRPDFQISWRGQPWLHVLYNRFFLKHLDEPEFFVSVIREKKLENRRDLERLINLGANPLGEMLGPDEEWMSTTK